MSSNELKLGSEYVTMRDGVCLAVSTWLTTDKNLEMLAPRAAVVITSRYWRACAFKIDSPRLQRSYALASYLSDHGFILVVADARGTGASFGVRESEISPDEVEDIGELIRWVAIQPWCDGSVATMGTSYTANTALSSLVTASGSLKLVVCRAPDFDGYRHLMAPGGVVNQWFIERWGKVTNALDRNDVKFLAECEYWPMPAESDNITLGVRPVESHMDASNLIYAIAQHKDNFNVDGNENSLTFVDRKPLGTHRYLFDSQYQEKIESSNVPIVIRCGWHDAGTALGALSMFVSFNCPIRVIIGAWSHNGLFRVDPFQGGDCSTPEDVPVETTLAQTVDSLAKVISKGSDIRMCGSLEPSIEEDYFGVVEYYTLGENRWKKTKVWPLPDVKIHRLYLAAEHRLSANAPTMLRANDCYHINLNTSTGLNNRWHTQMGGPVLFPDRQEDDKKLLVYDTQPLEHDVEITGHPVVHIWLRSTATDGQFFAYLETIDPDGRVRMLTEGQLRGLHRKISNENPPYHMFGPYHSLKEKDAQPLIPGEVAEISFDLFPISVLLKKGQRIRLAIAGADQAVFAPISDCESPLIKVERNSIYPSFIDLPVV